MNDEIKNILDEIEDYSKHKYLPPCCELTNEDCKQLLDYITNLQKENKDLKELCDKYEEEHNTTFKLWKMKMEEMPTYEEKIEMQKENQRLKEENNKLINEPTIMKMSRIDSVVANIYRNHKEQEDYKSRCEKAIEYIHNHQLVFELSSKKQIQDWFDMFYKDSLNILNGGDE